MRSRRRAAVQPSPDFPQGPLGSDHLVSSSAVSAGALHIPRRPTPELQDPQVPPPAQSFGRELAVALAPLVAAGDSALGWRHRGWEEPNELRPSRGD